MNSKRRRNLFLRHAPEEMHFYNLCFALVKFRQLRKCFVDEQQFGGSLGSEQSLVVERDGTSPRSTFSGLALPCMFHEDLPHVASRDCHEMRAILEVRRVFLDRKS